MGDGDAQVETKVVEGEKHTNSSSVNEASDSRPSTESKVRVTNYPGMYTFRQF